jgi:hypothetical protein
LSFLPMKNWLSPGVIFPLVVVFLSTLAAFTGNRRYHAAFAIFSLAALILALLTDPMRIE